MQKCDFLCKMAAISWNLEHLGPNFALHSRTTQDTCVQNIMGISAKLRGLGPEQRSPYTFWILMRRRLQTNQKYIGPTLFTWDLNIHSCICTQLKTGGTPTRAPHCLYMGYLLICNSRAVCKLKPPEKYTIKAQLSNFGPKLTKKTRPPVICR